MWIGTSVKASRHRQGRYFVEGVYCEMKLPTFSMLCLSHLRQQAFVRDAAASRSSPEHSWFEWRHGTSQENCEPREPEATRRFVVALVVGHIF